MKIGIIDNVRTEALVADFCAVCHKVTEHKVQVIQHIFILGLPWFPTGKEGRCNCLTCKTQSTPGQMPEYSRRKYMNLLSTAKTPVWAFTFPVIFAVLMVIVLIKAPFDAKRMNELIDHPKVGDIYHYDFDDHGSFIHNESYTLWKVVGSSSRSVYFVKSIYEVNSRKEAGNIDRGPDAWDTDTITYGKEWLKDQASFTADKYKISDIDRR